MNRDDAYNECVAQFPEGIYKTADDSGIFTDSDGGRWLVDFSDDGGIEGFAAVTR